MPTTADFLVLCQWVGIATLGFGVLAGLSFLFQWGIRFRLVGVTGFMAVLTGGLFALGLVPLTRTIVPGAVHYSLVFDDGAAQIVIAVPATISESELDATLRQAGNNFLSPTYGRLSRGLAGPAVRARTIVHPKPGLSQLVYLGQVTRTADQEQPLQVDIFADQLAQLPKSDLTPKGT
jgi:Protein of function (DUF2518)